MADPDTPVRTRYTVSHVRTDRHAVEHAVSLLDPSYTGYELTGKDGWTTIASTEADARTLAPALAGTLDQPVYLISVDGDLCAVSVAHPDQRVVAQDEAELADPALTGVEKHSRVLERLGAPAESPAEPTATVIVPCTSVEAVRARIPHAGHGAWLLPVDGGATRCVVVSDGSGWQPNGDALQSALSDDGEISMITVSWWHGWHDAEASTLGWLEVVTPTDSYEIALGPADEPDDDPDDSGDLDELVRTFGRLVGLAEDSLTEVRALIDESRSDLPRACAGLLALAGVTDVPTGATTPALAEWAGEQEAAVRLEEPSGPPLELRTSVAQARHSFVRRNRLHTVSRAFGWVGVFAFLAGLAVLLWGPPVWTVAAFALLVIVIAARAGVKRLIGPRGAT